MANDGYIEYEYDFAGHRIHKSAYGTNIKYVYDGDQVIAEYDDSGVLLRKYIYGPGIDEPICMVAPDGQGGEDWYFYHLDGLGSVAALSKYDSVQGYASIVERYVYDVFGAVSVCDGSGAPLNPNKSAYGNPYMFTGRRYDDETGLYYYRARMYAPDLGRFLQPDPIGYDDGMNMYAYVGNNPTSFVDPLGLSMVSAAFNAYVILNAPEEGIHSFEPQAAMTALSEIYGPSLAEGREYGGYVYKYYNWYTYTKPVAGVRPPAGTKATVGIGHIKPSNATASYHSHPHRKSQYYQFSPVDLANDTWEKVAGYVVVPSGEVFYHAYGELDESFIGEVSKCSK